MGIRRVSQVPPAEREHVAAVVAELAELLRLAVDPRRDVTVRRAAGAQAAALIDSARAERRRPNLLATSAVNDDTSAGAATPPAAPASSQVALVLREMGRMRLGQYLDTALNRFTGPRATARA